MGEFNPVAIVLERQRKWPAARGLTLEANARGLSRSMLNFRERRLRSSYYATC